MRYIVLLISSILLFVNSALAAPPAMPMMPKPVQVITIKPQQWRSHVNAIGTLVAEKGIRIQPEMPGRVTEIYFKSGQHIEKGQKLLQLNSSILTAEVKVAQSNLKLTSVEFKRTSDLYKRKAIAKAEYDKALAKLETARGDLERTLAQLSQSTIVAPFTGVLGLRKVSVGDYVNVGQPLVNLQTVDPMLVDFSLPERYISQLKAGQKFILKTDTQPAQAIEGQIIAYESLVDVTTRTILVRGRIPNTTGTLIPGAYTDVDLFLGQKQATVMIPKIAVLYSKAGNYVYRVVAGKAVKTPIKIARTLDKNMVVSAGLKSGDVVITSGQVNVNDGVAVKTI